MYFPTPKTILKITCSLLAELDAKFKIQNSRSKYILKIGTRAECQIRNHFWGAKIHFINLCYLWAKCAGNPISYTTEKIQYGYGHVCGSRGRKWIFFYLYFVTIVHIISILGTLSNDNDNNNVKKQLVLPAKQLLCTCITFFSTFLWLPLHDYDMKPPNAMFYGGRGHTTTNFPFSIWTWIKPLRIQLKEKSPISDELSGSKYM